MMALARRSALSALAVSGAAALLIGGAVAPAQAKPGGHRTGHPAERYVALGDSYTSGPAIPRQTDANCARSDHDYPALTARRIHAAAFTDASCAGAQTAQMWQPQGTNPPQLDALSKRTTLVSVGISGNDIGFGEIIATCTRLSVSDPAGDPCARHYTAGGTDQLADRIAATAPRVVKVLDAIHRRAPRARVFVVGYPDILPDTGPGCFPAVAMAAGDVPYLRGVEKRLNAMLRGVARHHRAAYVDTYGPTIGHDVCRSPADRWIEPLNPASPAAPFHPNAKGERAMAAALLDRLAEPGRGR